MVSPFLNINTTRALSSSIGMFSCSHHSVSVFLMFSGLSLSSSFNISIGMLSGPGAFLLFSFFIICLISSIVGGAVLYCS